MRTLSLPVLAACLCAAASWQSHARTEIEVNLSGNALVRDNFYYQARGNETTVTGVSIEPGLLLKRAGTMMDTHIKLGASAAKFNANPEDDYTDANASAGVDIKLGINAFRLDLNYRRGHDPFGSERTEDTERFDRELDIWQRSDVQLNWIRQGELRGDIFSNVGLKMSRKTYETNTDVTSLLDRSSRQYQGLVGVQLTQKTGVFISGRYTDYTFDEDSNGLRRSGNTTAYFGGIRWKATARTTGDLRYGVASRDSEGFDSQFWEVEFGWEPVLTHEFQISSSRIFNPSYRTDTRYFDTQTFELAWLHYWNHRVSSRVSGLHTERAYVGAGLQDSTTTYTARLTYAIDNELSLYGNLNLSSRDAEQNGYTYESNAFLLGFVTRLN